MEFDFYKYMTEFELRIIIAGAEKGVLGKQEKVSARSGKLSGKKFGRIIMRSKLPHVDLPVVLDYYGLMKKSDGFSAFLTEMRRQLKGKQIKSIEATVIHFASIRIETVAELAPDLVAEFPLFKKNILAARGFCKEVVLQ